MLKLVDAQNYVPTGLVLLEQMAYQVNGWAFKAEDRRILGDSPVLRFVRIIEISDGEIWRDDWLKQLEILTRSRSELLGRPLEAGTLQENHFYLIFDWGRSTLAELIPETGLSNRYAVWELMDRIVNAVAEWHKSYGPHGDVRSENIFVANLPLTHESRLWLGGIELGHLGFWSDGSRLDPDARAVFPPEWHGVLQKPTLRADVFALGLLAVELFAGRDARNRVTLQNNGSASARKLLGRRVTGWQWRQKLKPLLAVESHRYADAPEIRRSWLNVSYSGVFVRYLCAVLFVAVVVCVVWVREVQFQLLSAEEASRSLDQSNQSKISQLNADKKQLNKFIEEWKGKLGEERVIAANERREKEQLLSEIAKLKQPASAAKISDEEQAKAEWSKHFRAKDSSQRMARLKSLSTSMTPKSYEYLKNWDQLVQQAWDGIKNSLSANQQKAGAITTSREDAYYELRAEPWNDSLREKLTQAYWNEFTVGADNSFESIQSAIGKVPVKSWLRKSLNDYLQPLKIEASKWDRWRDQPDSLTKTWDEYICEPWEPDLKKRHQDLVIALEVAEQQWKEIDKRGDLTWSEFQHQLETAIAKTGNEKARTVVSTWIDQFNACNSVSFTLIRGKSPTGSGVFRTIDVHVDGAFSASDDELTGHNWNDETLHDYTRSPVTFSCNWKVGQSLRVKVYGARQSLRVGGRPLYIDEISKGPIAAWRLYQAGGVSSSQHVLQFNMTNCPGPPCSPGSLKLVESLWNSE